jgi:hypothetical protein
MFDGANSITQAVVLRQRARYSYCVTLQGGVVLLAMCLSLSEVLSRKPKECDAYY